MNINQLFIIGRLTKEPSITYSKDNKPICKFTVASNYNNDSTLFLDTVSFGNLAERCSQHLDKGQLVCIVGMLKQNTFQTSDGTTKSKIECICSQVVFLSKAQNKSVSEDTDNETALSEDVQNIFNDEAIL